MAASSTYDYTATAANLKPFVNPLTGTPFFTDLEATYGQLWEFKEHVANWSFGANRFKNYVYLRFRVQGKNPFHNWNLNEKVCLIEEHAGDYVVMSLREVDDNGREMEHVHSIVIN